MNLKVESLWDCPIEVFTDFLERLDYGHAPHWAGCYCRFYHSTFDFETWKNRLPSDNKADAIYAIENKSMHGFLAFDDQRCIGWLNANDVHTFGRLQNVVPETIKNRKFALTICFVIDPQYRNQKVATSLLNAAIHYYRNLGYDGMLAAPIEVDGDFSLKYRGTSGMYEKFGYSIIEKHGSLSVYELDFHKIDQ